MAFWSGLKAAPKIISGGSLVSRKLVEAAANGISKVLEKLMIVLVVAMMLSLFWQVFTRFIIKVPATWTEEIARYTFIYMVMIGAALGVRHSAHFGVTMLSDKLHGKARDYYQRFVINGIILVCAAALLFYGIEFTRMYGMNRVSPTFLIPMAWVYVIVPITGVLMMLFALQNMVYGDFSQNPHL